MNMPGKFRESTVAEKRQSKVKPPPMFRVIQQQHQEQQRQEDRRPARPPAGITKTHGSPFMVGYPVPRV